MRWFKFHADLINDPTLQRLPGDKFKTWINLLCITSKHDGILPPLTDLAFLLRPMVEDKIAALLEEFCEKGLLDPVAGEQVRYVPRDWASRQYVEAFKRGVTRDGRDGALTVTPLDQKQKKRTEQTGVTELIEVTDEAALAAWDDYGRATNGKPYPRNRRGGWRFPTKSGHVGTRHSCTRWCGGRHHEMSVKIEGRSAPMLGGLLFADNC